jgi:hypothetical protein
MTHGRYDAWTVEHVPVVGTPSVMAGDGRRGRLCWPYADSKISTFQE